MVNASHLVQYKQLLLAKRRELSVITSQASTRVPGAGDPGGDLIDNANADAEAELQIRLHHTDSRLLRAIEEALERIERAHTACAKRVGNPLLQPV